MPTCVAFLRAINVTGRFVKMAALAEAFHALGHADARTYINSGNVMFSAGRRAPGPLARRLEDGLEPLLGFRSEVFVRTADEVRALAARAAALQQQLPAGGEVNVCFLSAPPAPAQAEAVLALRSAVDDFVFEGPTLYWLCRTGQSASRFSNAVLERRLGARSTLRRGRMLQGLAAVL